MNKLNQLKLKFALYLVGVVIVFSAWASLVNLQSTLNIEDGLGTLSLAIVTGGCILSGLFLSPIALKFVNVKFAIMFSDFTVFSYSLANLYAVKGTLLTASIAAAVGRSFFFITIGVLNVHFTNLFHSYGKKGKEFYLGNVTGLFYAALMSTQLLGNLISFVALNGMSNEGNATQYGATTIGTYTNPSATNQPLKLSCGINECKESFAVDELPSEYEITNKSSIYYLIGVFIAMVLTGTVLHFLAIPRITEVEAKKSEKKPQASFTNPAFNTNDGGGVEWNRNMPNVITVSKSTVVESEANSAKSTQLLIILQELKTSWLWYGNINQLLITSQQVFFGLQIGFVYSELTRAYVACVFGIGQIGIAMSIYGLSALVASFGSGKLLGSYDRAYIMAASFALNLGLYIFCIVWAPVHTSSPWVIYAALSGFGIVNGIFQTANGVIVAILFPKSAKLAYMSCTVLNSLGLFINFSWSSQLCMSYKVAGQIALMVLSAATYGVAECRHRTELSTSQVGTEIPSADMARRGRRFSIHH